MSNPFQDKFLKAGLATKKQVGKAKIEQRKREKDQRRNKSDVSIDKPADLILKRQKELVRKSNAERDQAARGKEKEAQIRQLVEMNRIKVGKGETAFHFSDSNKIKKMFYPKEVISQLSTGRLGIAKIDGKYEVVPAETAEKIRERLPEALIVLNGPQEQDPNDPYAEFPVPDDYEW